MKIGINVGYSGRSIQLPLEEIKEAEAMGCDSVWTAEAYGSDALTPLAWIGAHTTRMKLATGIIQLSARTPAATAMAAMTLANAVCWLLCRCTPTAWSGRSQFLYLRTRYRR